MAKVIQPLMSSTASGNIAGIGFCETRSGSIVKSVSGVNRHPRIRANTLESSIANLGHIWKVISDVERESWNNAANDKLSGYNLFRQRNLRILSASSQPLTIYSNILPPSIPSMFLVYLSSYSLEITTDLVLSNYDVLQLFVQERKNIAIKPDFKKAHLFANVFDFSDNYYSDYEDAYYKNLIVWFRILNIESGNISPLIMGV